jgi:hypothetical protein
MTFEVRRDGRTWAIYGSPDDGPLAHIEGGFRTRRDAERRRDYLELDTLIPAWRRQAATRQKEGL